MNLSDKRHIYKILFLFVFLCALLNVKTAEAGGSNKDSIPSDSIIKVSVYPTSSKERSDIYNSIWGKHCRDLYYIPVTVPILPTTRLENITIVSHIKELGGIYVREEKGKSFLIKPLEGSSVFLQSDFFQEMYHKADFKDTYMDKFIADAYTIINPYTFLVSNHLAKEIGLYVNNPELYYLSSCSFLDTIVDGIKNQGRIVSVAEIQHEEFSRPTISTDSLFSLLEFSGKNLVDQRLYIRERLFDMLIGDWNKIPENWRWQLRGEKYGDLFEPIVIDRSHAFTRVEGFMFKQMLDVLSLGFISNYEGEIKNVKQFNKLGFFMDVAITSGTEESLWQEEAVLLKNKLTDRVIDDAFNCLPEEIKHTQIIDQLKASLKERRNAIDNIASRYYKELQYNPHIRATSGNDSVFVKKLQKDSLEITIYNKDDKENIFSHTYTKRNTKEIWLYGLDGDDYFSVTGEAENNIPVFFIAGKGESKFDIKDKSKIRIYDYKSNKLQTNKTKNAKVIFTSNEGILDYNYQKTKYHTVSFSPWGVYDSDWGLSLGSFVSFTQYGLNQSPFSYQHRIGYNYLKGFMYKGVFPNYNGKTTWYIDAFIGSPQNFSNFFGYGNNTSDFKDEKKNYNRVSVGQYSLTPSLQQTISPDQKMIFSSGLEIFRVKKEEGRYLSLLYGDDDPIFRTKYFLDLNIAYELEKEVSSFMPRFASTLSAGWKMNLKETERNFPYMLADIQADFALTDRLTLATNIKGKALFNNRYDFYHSASTELRGYRDSRFIGQYSFYQYSDLRLDMGKLKNPFAPLKYGLFIGSDYGRVWYPAEASKKWHISYGGGGWITILNKVTTKYSFFGSGDSFRFSFNLGLGF